MTHLEKGASWYVIKTYYLLVLVKLNHRNCTSCLYKIYKSTNYYKNTKYFFLIKIPSSFWVVQSINRASFTLSNEIWKSSWSSFVLLSLYLFYKHVNGHHKNGWQNDAESGQVERSTKVISPVHQPAWEAEISLLLWKTSACSY